MRKVLFVSYSFPPVGGAGVQRPAKFVKYLRDYGWEPVVLRVANPSVPVFDEGLLRDIPSGVTVHGARTLEPSYAQKRNLVSSGNGLKDKVKSCLKKIATYFILPDPQVLWWPGLVIKLVRVIRAENPKILFVTAPPFSSFLPVIFIGRIMRVPVILDYRDEWAFSRSQSENAVKHVLAGRLDLIFERYAVTRCSAFTAANASYVSSIYTTFPSVSTNKGNVITNGFDEDDFDSSIHTTVVPNNDKVITIAYTGTVWRATSLRNFMTALKTFLKRVPTIRDVLRVKIFGRIVDAEQEYFIDSEFAGVLHLCGYIGHSELMAETMAADILLLTLSDLPGACKIITGKAFEYMASGKHILAIVPKGETKDLLTENYNKLSLVDSNDFDGIYDALVDVVTNIQDVRAKKGCDVSCFSRKLLTSRLAAVFDQVVGSYEL